MDRFKKISNTLKPALSVTLLLLLICGLIYPLLMNALAGVIFPSQANGSLIEVDGRAVGSKFVGQEFTEDYFMKGRPSAVSYNTYRIDKNGNEVYNDGTPFGGLSSGSKNYGPSNPALSERVENDIDKFLEKNPGVKKEDIPTDLMTASGSGLDPHISPEAALIQVPAIAKASGLSEETIKGFIDANTEGKLFGIFGSETVNVLGVNIMIADAMGI